MSAMALRWAAHAMILPLLLAACSDRPWTAPADRGAGAPLAAFLLGADLRAICGPRTPDRLRLIQNASHRGLVRAYDLLADPLGATVEVREIGASAADPSQAASPARLRLDVQQYAAFIDRLQRTGGLRPPPPGAGLPARGYYWIVSGCHEGRSVLAAYDFPQRRFLDIGHPDRDDAGRRKAASNPIPAL